MEMNHEKEMPALKRVEGQIKGIQRMVSERKYCVDILVQLRSAQRALLGIEERILKRHVEVCVKGAVKSKSESELDRKLEEIMDLIKKFMR